MAVDFLVSMQADFGCSLPLSTAQAAPLLMQISSQAGEYGGFDIKLCLVMTRGRSVVEMKAVNDIPGKLKMLKKKNHPRGAAVISIKTKYYLCSNYLHVFQIQ